MAKGELGTARCENMFGDLAQFFSHVAIAPSSLTTYGGVWKLCAQWRQLAMGKGVYIDPGDGDEAVTQLAKFVAYAQVSKGNKLATAVG